MLAAAAASAGGCWAFWVPEMQGGRARRRGDGLPGMAMIRRRAGGGWRAKKAIFNQPLTTFLVVAMVLRLTVFFLCSYWHPIGSFCGAGGYPISPGLGVGQGRRRPAEGERGSPERGGEVAEKGTVLPGTGVEYSPTSSTTSNGHGGVAENSRGGSAESGHEII